MKNSSKVVDKIVKISANKEGDGAHPDRASSNSIKALIFDLDGTLLDSSDASISTMKHFLKLHNISASDEKIREVTYRSHAFVLREIFESHGLRLTDDLKEDVRQDYRKRLEGSKLMPHALKLLESTHDRAIMILATFSSSLTVGKVMSVHPLEKYFDIVICRDSITREGFKEKSDMLSYILKLTKLGPQEHLLIDDTPFELKGARRLGIVTMGVMHTIDDLDADYLVDDLKEAEKQIRLLLA